MVFVLNCVLPGFLTARPSVTGRGLFMSQRRACTCPLPLAILPGSAHFGFLVLCGLGGRQGSPEAETGEAVARVHSLGRCSSKPLS